MRWAIHGSPDTYILAILEAFSDVLSIDLEELTENILNNETAAKKMCCNAESTARIQQGGIGVNSHIRIPSKGGKL